MKVLAEIQAAFGDAIESNERSIASNQQIQFKELLGSTRALTDKLMNTHTMFVQMIAQHSDPVHDMVAGKVSHLDRPCTRAQR